MKIGKRKSLERIGRAAIREMAKAIFIHGTKRNEASEPSLSDDKEFERQTRRGALTESVTQKDIQTDIQTDKSENASKEVKIRPVENGLLIQRQSRPRRVSDMTKKERAEIAARAADGAIIKFN